MSRIIFIKKNDIEAKTFWNKLSSSLNRKVKFLDYWLHFFLWAIFRLKYYKYRSIEDKILGPKQISFGQYFQVLIFNVVLIIPKCFRPHCIAFFYQMFFNFIFHVTLGRGTKYLLMKKIYSCECWTHFKLREFSFQTWNFKLFYFSQAHKKCSSLYSECSIVVPWDIFIFLFLPRPARGLRLAGVVSTYWLGFLLL